MERGDEAELCWRLACDELLERTGERHVWDPGGVGLFGGLDEGGFPTGAFGIGFGGIGSAHAMIRDDGDERGDAEFGGFLEDPVHGLGFGDGLDECDGMWRFGDEILRKPAESDATFLDGIDAGVDAETDAVEDDDLLMGLEAEDGSGVVSIGITEIEDLGVAAIGWEEKPVHGR